MNGLRTALREHGRWIALVLLVPILWSAWGLRSVHRDDWDGYAFLIHPDEYHVGDRVTTSLRVPASFSDYLHSQCPTTVDESGNPALVNPKNPNAPLADQEPSSYSGCNSLNPRNLPWARTHVYGSWPTTTVRYLAEKLYLDNPQTPDELASQQSAISRNQIVTLGRIISTVADLVTLLALFTLGWLLAGHWVALLTAALYAFTAFAIQQSHFYAVDAQATAYGTLTLLCCVLLARGGRKSILWALLAGVFLGFAIASKINMAVLALVGIGAATQAIWRRSRLHVADPLAPGAIAGRLFNGVIYGLGLVLLAGVSAFLVMRVAMPDAFIGSTFMDLRPDPRFIEALGNAKVTASAELDFPPSHQFASRTPWIYDWRNMVVWGMGVPLGLAAWLGWLGLGVGMLRRRTRGLLRWLPLWGWVTFYFWWQGGQPIKPMRYHLPIYGTLVLFGAWGMVALVRRAMREQRPLLFRRVPLGAIAASLVGAVVFTTVFWGWGYSRIYARVHPRSAASEWVKHNIPPGAVISSDAWDIGVSNLDGTLWPGLEIPITAEDNREKLDSLLDRMDGVDYLAFTSNRAYGSLPQLPMRFPMSLNYFRGIFDGALGFEKVADFTSFPSFLGIQISDERADESWSVYDHPRVTIWRKTPAYNRDAARSILLQDVNLDEVYQLKPIDASPIPTMLQMTVERWRDQVQAGTWSSVFSGVANQLPLLAWVVLIELLGVAGFGLLWRLRIPLPDRGLGMARLAALLALAFGAWLPAAWQLWSFNRLWLTLVALALIGAGLGSLWRERATLRSWLRERRSAIITSQLLYASAFGLLLIIRILNPDLWHPAMGGEKPMNLAFLTATLKSQTFPPYDPWFAGGFMNYYYWGYVLVGTPMKLLGLDPALGFNLALPLLFGCTAQLAGSLAYNLLSTGRRVVARLERRAIVIAVVAAVAVALLGNLAQSVLYTNGLRVLGNPSLSFSDPQTSSQNLWVSGGSPVSDALAGLRARLDGAEWPFRAEWPYWNATRVVPGTINEFPFFSFLYGDLHAHVIALPLTILALLLLVALWRARQRSFAALAGCAAALGWLVGALKATNTWDYPTYLVISGVGVLLAAWQFRSAGAIRAVLQARQHGPISTWAPDQSARDSVPWRQRWLWIGSAMAVWILAVKLPWMPFNRWFGTGAYAQIQYVGTDVRMSIRDWLALYGLWFWVLVPWLFGLIRRLWSTTSALVIGTAWLVWIILATTLSFAGAGPAPEAPGAGFSPVYTSAALLYNLSTSVLIEPLHQHSALTALLLPLLLISLALLVTALRQRLRARELFTLVWLTAALGLLVFTEVVVLPGAGRMNIVFKFGYQAWTLLALASALALTSLWPARRSSRRSFHPAYAWRLGWGAIAALLVIAALWYPLTASAARVADRASNAAPRGLDGMAWMDYASVEENGPLPLVADATAIRWLRENVQGTPVILEAATSPYRWNTRIATWTGLPTLIGWDGHEGQQRAPAQGQRIVDWRKEIVRQLYTTPDPTSVQELLDRYGVQYIYAGLLEKRIYGGDANMATFNQLTAQGAWRVVYATADTQIFERTAQAPAPASLPPDFTPGLPSADPLAKITLTAHPEGQISSSTTADWAWLGANQWAAVALWLLLFELLALLVWPLALLVFRSQLSAAWGLSKVLGLLLLGWLVWFPASLGMLGWTRPTIVGGLALLALLGTLLWRWRAAAVVRTAWRQQRSRLLLTEGIFLLLFAAFTWLRAANPDLWHPYWGGEKPFEFGFLNAILRSDHLPPVDPFYAGGTINYYYYGLYLMALPMKLLGLDSAIGFNLAVATVGALIGTSAWSLGLLITRRRSTALLALLLVVGLGNLASFVPAGDSSGIAGVVRGFQGCDQPLDIERPACAALSRSSDFGAMIADALSHGTTTGITRRLGSGVPWFWGPSRVLVSPELNTINEFPLWSIVFADLHPHLIALMIVLLLIGLAWEASTRPHPWVALALAALALGALVAANAWDVPTSGLLLLLALLGRGWYSSGSLRRRLARAAGWGGIGLLVLALALALYAPFLGTYRAPIGGIWPIRIGSSLWPWLIIYGPFVLVLAGWLISAFWRTWRPAQVLITAGPDAPSSDPETLAAPMADLPSSDPEPLAAPMADAPSSDPETLAAPMADLPASDPETLAAPMADLPASDPETLAAPMADLPVSDPETLAAPMADLPASDPETLAGASAATASVEGSAPAPVEPPAATKPPWTRRLPVWAALGVLLLLTLQYSLSSLSAAEPVLTASVGVRVLLSVMLALIVLRLMARQSLLNRWALLLAFMGASVALGVEAVFVRDHLAPLTWESGPNASERMNTVFKFGYQVWTLWAMAIALALPGMLRRLRRLSPWAYRLWVGTLIILGCAMAVFPVAGTLSRIGTRFDQYPDGLTLDGLAYMDSATYTAHDTQIALADDHAAIKWLTRNITGTPVLLQSEEEFYRTFGIRIAASTGLPTIVSALHAEEQRPNADVGQRITAVQRIYSSSTSESETQWLLNRYNVGLVYVGAIEQAREGGPITKFASMAGLEQIYQQGSVTIYRTLPELRQLAYQWRPAQPQSPIPPPPTSAPPPAVSSQDDAELQAAMDQYNRDPTSAGYAFEVGRLLWDRGQGDQAAAILRQSADQHPDDIALHHLLGDVQISLGHYEEGVQAYQEGYNTAPTAENLNKLGTGYLAWAALDPGKLEVAQSVFERSMAENPALTDPIFHLGETLQRQGQLSEAKAMYERYLTTAPPDALWVELAKIHLNELN